MTNTEIINVILSSVVALTAVISIITAIVTLKQNNKMIEESTRPVIQVYSTRIDSLCYLVIKNFGQSSAIIDNALCDYKFSKNETGDLEGNIFDKISGAIIAQGQSIRCPLIGWELKKTKFNFSIRYHSSTHKYLSDTSVDIMANDPFANMHSSKTDQLDVLQNIYITQLENLKRKI